MICGIDEAGRGPVIGPLIVCGVAVEKDEFLRKLGVRDSKKLSRAKREDFAEKIERVADRIEIIEISAGEIDALRHEMTLNEFEVKIFASIIEKLTPRVAYVDSADVDEARFGRDIVNELGAMTNVISRHRADETYPVVSAASIMAKIRRDQRIAEIERDIGEPIGSGYPSDPLTVRFLESWLNRNGSLPPHTRLSWDTSARLLRLRSTRKLDQYCGEV